MSEYLYHVEDGQFSFDFKAPLLGKVGDKIKIYDYFPVDDNSDEIVELNEITIGEIDKENAYIECWGSIE
jgi:hypothetical protein